MLNQKIALGIDIGGTNTKFGLVDRDGEILFNDEISTIQFETPEALLSAIANKIKTSSPEINIEGIGIGAPNANYQRGTIEYAPNLTWKGIIPIADIAQKIFNVPAFITNDANAAAMGEMMYGAAKGKNDFIMITLGTGVGSGIVANGKLITGYNGFAGELGHVTVIPNGRVHHSTRLKGSLESYASATGIVQTAKEFLEASNIESSLKNIKTLTSKIIFDAALNGDLVAKKVFDFTASVLGLALANFALFSAPQSIILFGGVVKSGDQFINAVKEEMEKNLIIVFKNSVEIIKSALHESDAAILGAAALAWNK